jgi:hypothetical protein
VLLTKDLLFSGEDTPHSAAGRQTKKGDPSVDRERLPQDDSREGPSGRVLRAFEEGEGGGKQASNTRP